MTSGERNIFFFDCETGGLDAETSDMVEVAWMLTDPTGREIKNFGASKVFPAMPVDPAAASLNGYNPERWAMEAVHLASIVPDMARISEESVFAGHNSPFDWSFFKKALTRYGQKWVGDYHMIDTAGLMWPLLAHKKVEKVRLEAACDYFGIVNHAPHTAKGDVVACREVYLRLMKLYAHGFAP